MTKRIVKLALGASMFLVAAGFLLFAQGPEGTAVAKETAERITTASAQFQLRVVEARSVPAANVPLPFSVAMKHQIKGAFRSARVVLWTQEHATEYHLQSPDGRVRLHCLVRCQGDHVIGICVRYSGTTAPDVAWRFVVALGAEFPGYRILTGGENDG